MFCGGLLIYAGPAERRLPGGVPVLRFSLDPAAEYLAAIRLIFLLRQGAAPAFEDYFVKLRNIDGYPTLFEGYLAASRPATARISPISSYRRFRFLGSKRGGTDNVQKLARENKVIELAHTGLRTR